LSDIAVALFSVDSLVMRRIIVRPDSVLPDPYCNGIMWSDSINITPLLPAAFTRVLEYCPMARTGSLFTFSGWGPPYSSINCGTFPVLAAASPYFGRPIKSCGAQYTLGRFGIYPPGV